MSHVPERSHSAERDEAKLLAKAEARHADAERMIVRQRVLLEEVRASGLATTETEKSLTRLEAAAAECKAERDALVSKARQRQEMTAAGG